MKQDGDTPDPEFEHKVGYKNPPVEHRFKKGRSGNPRGRPLKRERSLIPRQARTDILTMAFQRRRVKTAKGEVEITTYEALLMALTKTAMTGQYSSCKLLINLISSALAEHYEAHPEFQTLEVLEKKTCFLENLRLRKSRG